MLNYFSSIALKEKVISALVRLPQSLTANERELGGKAVYKARALLRMADNNLHWSDAIICGGSPKVSSIKEDSANQFFIYPNPSSSLITIAYKVVSGSDCKILFRNILGVQVLLADLDCGGSHTEINMDAATSGVYLLSLVNNGHEQFIGKVSLIK